MAILPAFLRRKRVLLPAALAVCGAFFWFVLPFLVPLPEALERPPAPSPVVLDRHGKVIRRDTLPDFTRGEAVTLEEVPPDLIACTLAAEDKRFFSHHGIDFAATLRAVRELVTERRVVSGASTITQQLVKISSPPTQRGIPAKLREILGARRLEMTRTKREILLAYLNRLDYGNRRTGIAEGARYYFQKPLSELSFSECALLASVPRAPTRLNPLKRPEAALARRNLVLDRISAAAPDTSARVATARAEPLSLRPLPERQAAPWLAASAFPDQPVIRTTLDLDLQRDVEAIVSSELASLRTANVHHSAVVVLDNATGGILALVSSGDWHDPRGGQINGAFVPRSPGSTLKPFTYLLAFTRGGRYPGSIVADIPTRFRTPEGLNLPENYDRTNRGPVSIRSALACSLNVPAIRELNSLGGPEPLHRLLTDLGCTTLGENPGYYGLGLTLGNAPVKLVELTNAYATLARGGLSFPPTLLTDSPPPQARALFPSAEAWLVADILADPDARAPSFGRRGPLELPFPCAVKTGTSSDYHDNWCIGFTRDFTIGVWAGNFDQTPLRGISGVTGAGPIFRRAMERVHRDTPPAWIARPPSITAVRVDPRSGHRVTPDAPNSRDEVCTPANAPFPASSADYSPDGKVLLDASYREWFDSLANQRRGDFAIAPDRHSLEPLRILAPADGVTCLLDPELPSGGKRLRLSSNQPGTAVWSSATLEVEPGEPEPFARLAPGVHTLVATDPRDGSTRQVTIRVTTL